MIVYRVILSGIVLCLTVSGVNAAQRVAPVSISINLMLPSELVARNGQARMVIVVKNNTARPIEFLRAVGFDWPAKGNYYIEVRHLDGSLVPLRAQYQDMYENGDVFVPGLYQETTVEPYGRLRDGIFLNEFINFDRQGIYLVTAKRKLPASLGGGWVKSNTLQFTMPKLGDNPMADALHEENHD